MNLEKLIKEHAVDSAANILVNTPTYAALEFLLLSWDRNKSLNARALSIGLAVAGMGYINAKGRDIYRKLLNITDVSKERMQRVQDKLYQFGFGMMLNPLFYYASGQRNVKELVVGSLTNALVSLYIGDKLGIVIDCARDITNIQKSHRTPEFIKKNKYAVAIGSVVASAALTYLIYNVKS